MLRMSGFPIYYDAPGGEGGGNNGGDGSQGAPSTEQRLEQALANLASRQGGMDAAGMLLLQENREYRERIRGLEQQLGDLKGKVPADDAVVLDSEQGKSWQAYQELGKPDDLRTVKSSYTTLQRDLLYRDAAAAHGLKAAVLGQLPGVNDLQFEIREIEQDGKKAKVAYIKTGDGQERPLPDYVKETWEDFLPALQQKPDGPGAGTPWPRQDAGGQGTAVDPIQATLDRRYRQRDAQEK